MTGKLGIAALTGALTFACAGTALAQDRGNPPDYLREDVLAPRRAVEVGVDTGFTQGFGVSADNDMDAGPGAGVGLTLGYRFTPRIALSTYGSYQQFNATDGLEDETPRGLTAGIEASYHFNPYARLDPVVTLGTGYRAVFNAESDPDNDVSHAFQLLKAEAELDVRLNRNVAVGPMLGADIDAFSVKDPPGAVTAADDGVHLFIYAGAQGRFDVGGERAARPEPVVAER
jgi:hypothetical protein